MKVKKQLKLICFFLFLSIASFVNAQQFEIISGRITDIQNNPIEAVNIVVVGTTYGTTSDSSGRYSIKIPAPGNIILSFSYVGFYTKQLSLSLIPGKKLRIDQQLDVDSKILSTVNINTEYVRNTTITRIDAKDLSYIPSASGSVEALIKTLPGVSSSSELSSQYSVRGGNFDENLIYVNDIEIYRPFLISSGQQEGLSFVNSDLVSSIKFSAGGFDAFYGDRMSSVLDITYKKPTEYRGSIVASLLGGTAHFEGCSKNQRFTHITGVRYKTTKYLLGTLETEGEYKPNFADIQSFITYDINKKLELNLLGNYSDNSYTFIPKTRETAFGTSQKALMLNVFYEGNEADKYKTYMGAVSLNYKPTSKHLIKFINSTYRTDEYETFDIRSEYLINDVDNNLDPQLSDSAVNIGVGASHDHARNFLNLQVYSTELKGIYSFSSSSKIKWGLQYQYDMVDDQLKEWHILDSTGYSLPYSDSEIILNKSLKAFNKINSSRIKSYIHYSKSVTVNKQIFSYSLGTRTNYWSFNNEFLVSPRATISLKPFWKNDFLFRLSGGLYSQPAFYREMRKPDGSINTSIKAQQSIHIVFGSDYNFMLWSRPFKLINELYYKQYSNLIPYKIDNVRLRYSGYNMAKGFATGFDTKINGEFVKGTESWLSLSFMRTMEDIKGDYFTDENGNQKQYGYYPRPTDQLINFGMFFQDYLPLDPSYKMQLTFLYGTRLPITSPNSDSYYLNDDVRMPPYRRVDAGFFKILKDENFVSRNNFFSTIRSMTIGLEIFNLFNINNTISYLWVNTLSSDERVPAMFAIPNYLTGRRINIKITLNF